MYCIFLWFSTFNCSCCFVSGFVHAILWLNRKCTSMLGRTCGSMLGCGVLGLPPQLKLGVHEYIPFFSQWVFEFRHAVIGGSHVGGLVFQTERSGMEEEEGAPHLISLRVGWAPLLHPRADVAEGFWYKRFHRFVYVPPNPVSPVLARVKTRQVVIQKSTVKHILGTTFGTEHQLNNGCNSWKWHLQFISDMLKSMKQIWLIWEYTTRRKTFRIYPQRGAG
jgi:hypothetical protein